MLLLILKLISSRKAQILTVVIAGLLCSAAVWAASASWDVTLSVTGNTWATVRWAIPEARGTASTSFYGLNNYYLTVRTADDYSDVLYVSPGMSSTTDAGENLTAELLSGVSSGTYDVYIKTDQHLSRKLNDIGLSEAATNTLNFTQTDNSPAFGSVRLLGGDVNGSTVGDDVVNSVDLNVMIGDLDKDDLTTSGYRPNVNRDVVINSVDLSVLIDNLDKEGDQ